MPLDRKVAFFLLRISFARIVSLIRINVRTERKLSRSCTDNCAINVGTGYPPTAVAMQFFEIWKHARRKKTGFLIVFGLYFFILFVPSSLFFCPVTRSRGTSRVFISVPVSRNICRGLWCYRASRGKPVAIYTNLEISSSSGDRPSRRNSRRRNNVIKENRVLAGGDNTLLKAREPPSLNCGLI